MGDTTDERLQFEGEGDQMRGRVKEAWGALSDPIERKLRDISSR